MTNRPSIDYVEDKMRAKHESFDLSDLDSLASLARSSEDHEAYRVVAAREHFRVGLVVNAAPDTSISFRIEVMLQILANDTQPKVADLERMNKILENLVKRGYSLDHHDSCWVSCEMEVAVDDIEEECLAVMAILEWMKNLKT